MNQPAWDLIQAVTAEMAADPDSDVVHTEEFEGRWAVRMRQRVRDFTTVWFSVGERTVAYEAYVLGAPSDDGAAIHRQLLARNHRMYRCWFAIDVEGDIYLRGRIALTELSRETVDEILGAIYEAVELSFRSLLRLLPGREKMP